MHWRVMFTRNEFSETPFFENKFDIYFYDMIDEPDTYLGLKVFLLEDI